MMKVLIFIAYLATPASDPVMELVSEPSQTSTQKAEAPEVCENSEKLKFAAEPASESEKPRFYFYNPDGIGAHAFHTPWAVIIESGLEEYDARPLSKLNLWNGQKRCCRA